MTRRTLVPLPVTVIPLPQSVSGGEGVVAADRRLHDNTHANFLIVIQPIADFDIVIHVASNIVGPPGNYPDTLVIPYAVPVAGDPGPCVLMAALRRRGLPSARASRSLAVLLPFCTRLYLFSSRPALSTCAVH